MAFAERLCEILLISGKFRNFSNADWSVFMLWVWTKRILSDWTPNVCHGKVKVGMHGGRFKEAIIYSKVMMKKRSWMKKNKVAMTDSSYITLSFCFSQISTAVASKQHYITAAIWSFHGHLLTPCNLRKIFFFNWSFTWGHKLRPFKSLCVGIWKPLTIYGFAISGRNVLTFIVVSLVPYTGMKQAALSSSTISG